MISLHKLYAEAQINKSYGQRWGQALVNAMPNEMVEALVGTLYDPYEIRDHGQLMNWCDRHLVYDETGVYVTGFKCLD